MRRGLGFLGFVLVWLAAFFLACSGSQPVVVKITATPHTIILAGPETLTKTLDPEIALRTQEANSCLETLEAGQTEVFDYATSSVYPRSTPTPSPYPIVL